MTSEDGCAFEAHTSSMFMAHWGSVSLLKGGMEEGGVGILEATGWFCFLGSEVLRQNC